MDARGRVALFDWDVVWREYPMSGLLGQTIQRFEPMVESDTRYVNFGMLCGAAVVLETHRLCIRNAIDENLMEVLPADDERIAG